MISTTQNSVHSPSNVPDAGFHAATSLPTAFSLFRDSHDDLLTTRLTSPSSVMRTRSRVSSAAPAPSPPPVLQLKAPITQTSGMPEQPSRPPSQSFQKSSFLTFQSNEGLELRVHVAGAPKLLVGDAETAFNMAQVNGYFKEQSPQEPPQRSGRVASMTRAAASPEQSPTPETSPWSSAVGHASTGKSGRVIERLQGDIDRLHREKQVLKMRHDEVEKANETLTTRNQYLQDRNSNYEQSHDANIRQIARKERQLDDLKEELNREKEKTIRAEEQARVASISEEEWRAQASQAKAVAAQRESEYDAIVSCRTMDNDRHQHGLDKIRSSFEALLRQREEDMEKQKKLEIIAEQQKQTIEQLEELNKKLNVNFKAYKTEIDTAVEDLRSSAQGKQMALEQQLSEMTETTGRMRWVMKVDEIVNQNPPRPGPPEAIMIPKEVVVEPRLEDSLSPSKSPTRTGRQKLRKGSKPTR